MQTIASSSLTAAEWREAALALPGIVTAAHLQDEVSRHFGLSRSTLLGPGRNHSAAWPRMIAMFLCRQITSLSYPEIGAIFGGRDHSTVISAVRKVDRVRHENPAVQELLQTLAAGRGPVHVCGA
jgi:chromosomal replication initiator protein